MTIEEKLKERAELVKNALGRAYFVQGSDGYSYKVDCVNGRWVTILGFDDDEHGVIIKNAIMDGDKPVEVDVLLFGNDDPTDIILTEEAVDFRKVPSLVLSYYKKYNDPNDVVYDGDDDITALCKEICEKTGFKFRTHIRDGNLVIDYLYKDICYFAVEDIKVKDKVVESATTTLKYNDMPKQKVNLSFGNIPRDEIARSIDKLYWLINYSMDAPYIDILTAFDMCCI